MVWFEMVVCGCDLQITEETFKFLAKVAAIENNKYIFRNLEQWRVN